MNFQAQHRHPVWRGKSNFIISISTDSEETGVSSEQFFSRQIEDRQFELCCIPFFAYDLALGDVVETNDEYAIQRVVRASGRWVFRVWMGDSSYPRSELMESLTSLGASLEWFRLNLLAVDARDAQHAQQIAEFLMSLENSGFLTYETGKLRFSH